MKLVGVMGLEEKIEGLKDKLGAGKLSDLLSFVDPGTTLKWTSSFTFVAIGLLFIVFLNIMGSANSIYKTYKCK